MNNSPLIFCRPFFLPNLLFFSSILLCAIGLTVNPHRMEQASVNGHIMFMVYFSFVIFLCRWWLYGIELLRYSLDPAITQRPLTCGLWVVYLQRWWTGDHYFLGTLRLMNCLRFSGAIVYLSLRHPFLYPFLSSQILQFVKLCSLPLLEISSLVRN